MAEQHFIVREDEHHLRLDIFLFERFDQRLSRSRVKRLIDGGQVTVSGRPAKAGQRVAVGDAVEIPELDIEAEAGRATRPEDIPLDIVYEDPALIVLNKPAGLTVHPAPGCPSGTLVNALLQYCRPGSGRTLSDVGGDQRPGIVHRLDKATSGLLIVVKDNVSHIRLARQFERHRVEKTYVALVSGAIDFDEGLVDIPVGQHPVHRDKKAASYCEDARPAQTFYRVRRRFSDQATLVNLFPRSGRTHQLRVHMAYLGHPILGDDKYGSGESFPRLALHSQSIGLTHPQTGSWVAFSIPTPEEILRGPQA